MKNTKTTPYRYGGYVLECTCENIDECEEEHNQRPGNEGHHYGCDCDECLNFYRTLK